MKPNLVVRLLLLVSLGFVSSTARSEESSQADKLNVLFICIDDLRVELGCYGDTPAITPNIDKLAKSGMLFRRAYCQQAVCNTSRASALTGLRPDTLDVHDLFTHFRENRPEVVTLPQMFKLQGYHTEGIGKVFHNWHQHDFKGDAPSWSVPQVLHYNTHGNDKPIVQSPVPPNLSKTPRTEMREVPDNAYFDGQIADKAIVALEKLQQTPFFLAVGFWKPHLDFNAPKRYWDLYDSAKISAPNPAQPPQDVPPLALHEGSELLRAYGDRPGGLPTEEEILELRRGYYAAVSYVDAQVGRVVDELDKLGLRDRTIIVLWSDHGFHLGEHGLWCKTSNFELDARVPLIIDVPGYRSNVQSESLVELLDLFPTLADLCHLTAPQDLEGKSLVPVLKNPEQPIHDAAYTQHPRPAYTKKGESPTHMGHSVRTDRYRYTEWRDLQNGEIVGRELYDHRADPDETINLAQRHEHHEIISELSNSLLIIH